jgi:hypothetical protein
LVRATRLLRTVGKPEARQLARHGVILLFDKSLGHSSSWAEPGPDEGQGCEIRGTFSIDALPTVCRLNIGKQEESGKVDLVCLQGVYTKRCNIEKSDTYRFTSANEKENIRTQICNKVRILL